MDSFHLFIQYSIIQELLCLDFLFHVKIKNFVILTFIVNECDSDIQHIIIKHLNSLGASINSVMLEEESDGGRS